MADILGGSGDDSDKDPTWQPEKDEQRGKIYWVLPTEDTIEETSLASNTDIAGAVDEFPELPTNYGPQTDLRVESAAHCYRTRASSQ
uniref:Uncharacterized protein n=1 Tax=Timema bartmani TaxID=61472 RepID=A0A7R9I6C7_9NEOP|nr:unnamed protein product [Timema bartmani]